MYKKSSDSDVITETKKINDRKIAEVIRNSDLKSCTVTVTVERESKSGSKRDDVYLTTSVTSKPAKSIKKKNNRGNSCSGPTLDSFLESVYPGDAEKGRREILDIYEDVAPKHITMQDATQETIDVFCDRHGISSYDVRKEGSNIGKSSRDMANGSTYPYLSREYDIALGSGRQISNPTEEAKERHKNKMKTNETVSAKEEDTSALNKPNLDTNRNTSISGMGYLPSNDSGVFFYVNPITHRPIGPTYMA